MFRDDKTVFRTVTFMILAGAVMRLVPHPWNFTPIAGMALFGGAYFRDRRAAFGVPLAAMLLSDFALAATVYGISGLRGIPAVYMAFALTVLLGRLLARNASPLRVGSAAVVSALLFYVVSNFGVWLWSSLYPLTWEGLVSCYVAAIPYLRNAAVGNLVYSAIFFGGFALAQRRFPTLREDAESTVACP